MQAVEGVVAVVTAADIPGTNNFNAANAVNPEEVCLLVYNQFNNTETNDKNSKVTKRFLIFNNEVKQPIIFLLV